MEDSGGEKEKYGSDVKKRIAELEDLNLKLQLRDKLTSELLELKKQLLSPSSLHKKLKVITDGVVRIFDADFARIWLVSPADLCDKGCIHTDVTEGPDACTNRSSCLHLAASSGRYIHLDGDHRRVPMGCYKIGRIAAGIDFKFITNDVVHDPRVHDRKWAREIGLVSFAGFKLSSKEGKPIGVLALFKKKSLDHELEFLLEDLANTTSQVILAGTAEKLLQESEKKYHNLFENAPVAMYRSKIDGSAILDANQKLADLFGYSKEELLEKPSIIHWIDPKQRKELIKELKQKGTINDHEIKIKTRKGIKTVLASLKMYPNAGYIEGTFIDITERRKLERALIESESKYRALTESSTDSIYVFDRNLNYRYLNNQALKMIGREYNETIGNGLDEVFPGYICEQMKKTVLNVFNTGKTISLEGRYTFPVGEHWLNTSIIPLRNVDGEINFVFGISRDISERKKREESIELQNKTLEGINKIFEMVISVGNEEELAEKSLEVCEELTGSKFGFIVERNRKGNLDTLAISNPGWKECQIEEENAVAMIQDMKEHGLYGKVSKDGKPLLTNDPNNHKDSIGTPEGHPVIKSFLEVPLIQGGNVIGSICLGNKEDGFNLEEQVILEKLSVAISESLMRKRAENSLKVALDEKELLLKEIHHRVKNNLMVISSLLNLQSKYIKDKDVLDVFKESQNRAQSMALIHERLYRSTDLKKINFGEYITTLANEMFLSYVKDPNRVTLQINIEDLMVEINTAIPLGLMVNELLSNSMKYAFPDDMEGCIIIEFYKINDEFVLIIKDNGVGFSEGLDFKNTDSLGLQLVNRLADQIDAAIILDVDDGTKFTIKFRENLID